MRGDVDFKTVALKTLFPSKKYQIVNLKRKESKCRQLTLTSLLPWEEERSGSKIDALEGTAQFADELQARYGVLGIALEQLVLQR